jgi:hypothetical protein
MSLSMATPKAKAICLAIRGQPQRGFRRFISTTASTSSFAGPWARATLDSSAACEMQQGRKHPEFEGVKSEFGQSSANREVDVPKKPGPKWDRWSTEFRQRTLERMETCQKSRERSRLSSRNSHTRLCLSAEVKLFDQCRWVGQGAVHTGIVTSIMWHSHTAILVTRRTLR